MIIPALDLLKGRVVRLRQGDYNRTEFFPVSPLQRIRAYARAGAQFLHLVDLEGARDPARRQRALIAAILKNSPIPVETGGGIRSSFDVCNLLSMGAARVVVGSAAVQHPEQVRGWIRRFGAERFTLALDVKLEEGNPMVAVHGWTRSSGITLQQALRPYLGCGIRHVLVTDISRDGMMQGSNTALYRVLAKAYPALDIIASGGISSLEDLKAAAAAGASSVVLGRALLEGRFSVEEALKCWPDA